MIDAFLQGTATVFQPMVFLSICVGVILGVGVGVTAIGGMVACALFLPFVYHLSPELALSFLVALTSVVFTGGSITSVLLGVPGNAPNAATVIDGFPMAQKGEAGRALGAAIGSSMFGAYCVGLLCHGDDPDAEADCPVLQGAGNVHGHIAGTLLSGNHGGRFAD